VILPDDPWRTALDAMSASPPRVLVARAGRVRSWRPSATRNPRHAGHGCFREPDAVDFVRRRLREIVAGKARAMLFRGESLVSDPTRWAFVLVVSPLSPRSPVPPVYVKWTLVPQGPGNWAVEFISFHESTHSP
jgi:hypothetical protein